jgi:hypothetical protein
VQSVQLVELCESATEQLVNCCCCEKLVAEAGGNSGTQMEENVRLWNPLPSNGNENVTVDISVCVFVCVIIKYKA